MTMSLNQLKTQALGSIADGLAGSDPRLASMLTIFSRPADRLRDAKRGRLAHTRAVTTPSGRRSTP
jgi:hypothetical protein